MQEFKYYLSSDIDLLVTIRMTTLYYPIFDTYGDECIFMMGKLYSNGEPLVKTASSCQFVREESGLYKMNSPMELPLRYKDCPQNTQIVLTLLDKNLHPFAITSLALYDKMMQLRQGYQKVNFFSIKNVNPIMLPCDCGYMELESYLKWKQMNKFDESMNDYSSLDEKVLLRCKEIEDMYEKKEIEFLKTLGRKLYKRKFKLMSLPQLSANDMNENENLISLCALLDLHRFSYPVIMSELSYKENERITNHAGEWVEVVSKDSELREFHSIGNGSIRYDCIEMDGAIEDERMKHWQDCHGLVIDYEIDHDNPVDKKWNELNHAFDRIHYDPNAKPTNAEKSKLLQIIARPHAKNDLADDDMTLLWKYRHVLYGKRHALPNILFSMNLNDKRECQYIDALLNEWPILDTDDTLMLLSADIQNEKIREYAAYCLNKLDDEELELYLLQLVQALRYEPSLKQAVQDEDNEGSVSLLSPLKSFLFKRCQQSITLASWCKWYLHVECKDGQSKLYNVLYNDFMSSLPSTEEGEAIFNELNNQQTVIDTVFGIAGELAAAGGRAQRKQDRLKEILADKKYDSLFNNALSIPLHPNMRLSCLLRSKVKVYQSVMTPFCLQFPIEGSEAEAIKTNTLLRRDSVSTISEADKADICKGCNKRFGNCYCTNCIECDKMIAVTSKHHCRSCKYAVCESCCSKKNDEWYCNNDENCIQRTNLLLIVMFKNGDDCRQDQLVIQMIRLMDNLLKRMNLDLKLSPYGVLACSNKQGIIEMVQNCKALSGVKRIQAYLKENNPDKKGEYGISPVAMDNYVKSCAGYAVITYLLGIGDRHKDNIMIDKWGHFFHIDFGYIFGKDPKLREAEMRITSDMIDGFGGRNSKNYGLFLSYCYQAYHILRQNAVLIINMLRMMLDADIKDVKVDTLQLVINRFDLESNDEIAEANFKKVLDACINNLYIEVLEFAHKVATAAR